MKKLFVFFFLVSCSSPITSNKNNIALDFNDNLTFDEFSELLIKYAKTSPYPNIDQ